MPEKFWFCPNTFLSLPKKFIFFSNFQNLVGNRPRTPSWYCSGAKTNEPFTTGEELILPTRTDIGREVFGESAAEKVSQLPLSVCTVAIQIEDMAEDIKTRLLQRIVTSPWFTIQCDESTDMQNITVLLVYVRYLYEEDIHENMLCALLLPKKHHRFQTIQVSE